MVDAVCAVFKSVRTILFQSSNMSPSKCIATVGSGIAQRIVSTSLTVEGGEFVFPNSIVGIRISSCAAGYCTRGSKSIYLLKGNIAAFIVGVRSSAYDMSSMRSISIINK